MNHESLLLKYITYVRDVFGADFIADGYRGYAGDQTFTNEEWQELSRLSRASDEVRGEPRT